MSGCLLRLVITLDGQTPFTYDEYMHCCRQALGKYTYIRNVSQLSLQTGGSRLGNKVEDYGSMLRTVLCEPRSNFTCRLRDDSNDANHVRRKDEFDGNLLLYHFLDGAAKNPET